MCRDGFRAPCSEKGCTKEVTCRDFPRLCDEHYPTFWDEADPWEEETEGDSVPLAVIQEYPF